MATNIEQIFRDFVMNKIKEIADESEDNSHTEEPQSKPVTESKQDGLETGQMNISTDKVMLTDPLDDRGTEDNTTKHRKNKKHKKHKSKKKKKKRKEGKDSSTETQSDREIQDGGKKKKRKKKKKYRDADKVKRSRSRSESSSASASESESKPSSENAKTSKSELNSKPGLGTSPLPDIIPMIEISIHNNAKDKKRSSSMSSKKDEKRTRSRSPKTRHRSRSRSSKRHRRSKSTSKSRKRPHQRREKSRSPSGKRKKRSRSRSVRRSSRSRSRRSRSRSRKNRRSASKSRSRSKTKCSKSRSRSKSKSVLKETQKEAEPVENEKVQIVENSEVQTEETTEKSPSVAVNLDTKLPETVTDGLNSNLNAVVVKGSWRPVPFLVQSRDVPECQSSQKCITPEVPLEVLDVSAEPSTGACKDSEDSINPDEKDTTPDIQIATQRDSKSPSKSPSQQRSTKSKLPARSRSKSSSQHEDKKSKSRSPSERKKKSKAKHKRSKSRSPKRKRSRSRSSGRRRRSRTPDRSKRSKSRRKSRSRSRRRSGSGSGWRRGFGSRTLNQRDRWRREPSRSPVLILRKKRSTSRNRRSTSKTPPRLTELDKEQLLEIAKANAAAMCTKAGVPIPESLRPKTILQLPLSGPNSSSLSLPLSGSLMTMNAAMASMTAATMSAALSSFGALASLSHMAPLPTIVNKPPASSAPNSQHLASIEEAKRKVTKQANSFSIKELTERCKKIVESKEEMAIAKPHVSDDEDDEQGFGTSSLKETKGIAFSLGNTSLKPGVRAEAAFAKEFPVSSGSQHRKKEADGAYGEWVPVEKKTEKPPASGPAVTEEPTKSNDSVFPEAPSQPVDITLAVSERAVAQKRLAENPFDINAMCMLSRAQEQVDAWAQSNTIPGLFTGSTGATVLSSEELSNSGPQAWIKKQMLFWMGTSLFSSIKCLMRG
ncbi:uncharacterized protein sonb isoform X2 [Paramisgurnus dabryanus]|uniref:uncharacterized protein sonb isoform X2 n=1 Tax=Paramisgurnus dabryanus TaxID=90735 RepID=UPI0031F3FF72